ncbi:hypothetical protein ACIRU3_38705 [Streptomyces sp. NPDC101151]|uniref:hypothetical protein n=1 Tax=Streptomyces sp. NPDC101151 TaxID=3366115 RepID=UPI0037FBD8A0
MSEYLQARRTDSVEWLESAAAHSWMKSRYLGDSPGSPNWDDWLGQIYENPDDHGDRGERETTRPIVEMLRSMLLNQARTTVTVYDKGQPAMSRSWPFEGFLAVLGESPELCDGIRNSISRAFAHARDQQVEAVTVMLGHIQCTILNTSVRPGSRLVLQLTCHTPFAGSANEHDVYTRGLLDELRRAGVLQRP